MLPSGNVGPPAWGAAERARTAQVYWQQVFTPLPLERRRLLPIWERALLMVSHMHAGELIELAGLVAAHSPVLIEGHRRIPAECIEQYWTSSKVRMDRWARTLKGDAVFGPRVRGTIEEIFAGEVLARVWTAVLSAYDRRRGADEAEPVARSVLIGHVEARHRALTWLLRAAEIDAKAAVELNRLRRRAERWTDLLIEEINTPGTFAANHPSGRIENQLRTPFSAASPNPELNARIAASVIASFPAESFEGVGLCRSLWLARVMSAADDAQRMIDGLLAPKRSFGG